MRIKFDKREDGIKISTIKAEFLIWYGTYETAIMMPYGSWKVVASYKAKKDAIKGHIELLSKPYFELEQMKQIAMID